MAGDGRYACRDVGGPVAGVVLARKEGRASRPVYIVWKKGQVQATKEGDEMQNATVEVS